MQFPRSAHTAICKSCHSGRGSSVMAIGGSCSTCRRICVMAALFCVCISTWKAAICFSRWGATTVAEARRRIRMRYWRHGESGSSKTRKAVAPHCMTKTKTPARCGRVCLASGKTDYCRWLEMSLVISNMDTCFFPPNTALSLSSALIMRLFALSCSLFFLM